MGEIELAVNMSAGGIDEPAGRRWQTLAGYTEKTLFSMRMHPRRAILDTLTSRTIKSLASHKIAVNAVPRRLLPSLVS
jgi:hypothetical protein